MKKNTINTEDKATKSETEVILNQNVNIAFVNKLTINGEQQKESPKKIITNINGKNLDLNCKYIEDGLVADAYINSFKVPADGKDVQVFYAKTGTVLSACIYVNGKLEYSSMAMQAIFSIVEAAFGVNKLITDKLYIMSNSKRKKPPEPKSKTEVKDLVVL